MSRETAEEIDLAAADWAARVDRGLSSDDERALDAWLGADPRRVGAYGKVRGTALYTERARALGHAYDPAKFRRRAPSSSLSRRGVLLVGGGVIAASVAGVAVVGLGLADRGEGFSTRLGEVKVTPLADGSVMTLNTVTRAEVMFTEGERRVQLLEGEALFDVAKDPNRPFVVDTGGTLVRAVGTSFTVRRLGRTPVEVLVREGVVEVRHSARAAATPPVRVVANTRAVAMPTDTVEAVTIAPDAVARELAWREGRIAFEGETLREAARQFARYSETRIVIDDPAIAAEQITGLFQANDPVGFARTVATSFGLRADIRADEVRLVRRA